MRANIPSCTDKSGFDFFAEYQCVYCNGQRKVTVTGRWGGFSKHFIHDNNSISEKRDLPMTLNCLGPFNRIVPFYQNLAE